MATKTAFDIEKALIEKIRAIAYWERRKIKDVLTDALANYVSEYEKTKEIEPMPKENKES